MATERASRGGGVVSGALPSHVPWPGRAARRPARRFVLLGCGLALLPLLACAAVAAFFGAAIFAVASVRCDVAPTPIIRAGNPATRTAGGPDLPGLAAARADHTTTLLPDGRLLVVGGQDDDRFSHARCFHAAAELYEPAAGASRPAGALADARADHTATLLPDGRVLVVGGEGRDGPLATVERYDPAAGRWQAAAPLATARRGHTATMLPNGRVLVVGGRERGQYLATVEEYDPATDRWRPTGPLRTGRGEHTATLLPDGRVLVAGGLDYHSSSQRGGTTSTASAEVYDPASDAWQSAGQMALPRAWHTSTLLASGEVLVVGGSPAATDIYTPATGTWRTGGALAAPRVDHAATLLPDGRVLVTGGQDRSYLATVEEYDPATDRWQARAPLAVARTLHTATPLPDGRVLLVGGLGHDPKAAKSGLAHAEAYPPRP